jgi:hypothetical protein
VVNTATIGVRQTMDVFKLGINYNFKLADLAAIAPKN